VLGEKLRGEQRVHSHSAVLFDMSDSKYVTKEDHEFNRLRNFNSFSNFFVGRSYIFFLVIRPKRR